MIILVDHREQAPYSFAGLDVASEVATLRTGDYSLKGHADAVAVSRKSLEDLYATILSGVRRRRFERELARLAAMAPHGHVVVEGALDEPPPHGRSGVLAAAVRGRVRHYLINHPGVSWHFMASRREAEVQTARLLTGACAREAG